MIQAISHPTAGWVNQVRIPQVGTEPFDSQILVRAASSPELPADLERRSFFLRRADYAQLHCVEELPISLPGDLVTAVLDVACAGPELRRHR